MYGGTTTPISLDTILQVKPRTWSSANYIGKIYVTEELHSHEDEYEQIEEEMRKQGIHKTISKIERIQHPFAYGRFLLRKEQLEQRSLSVQPTRKFYRVENNQVKEAIEYNMDTRRTSSISEMSAYSSINSDYCVVVVQQIRGHSYRERDSEEYPEYIIHFD